MNILAFDTETHQIGPGAVAPKIVCASLAWFEQGESEPCTGLIGSGDALEEAVEALLDDAIEGRTRVVTHTGEYDYSCVCATWPRLIPKVFRALQSGNCVDTKWRERLLNLSSTGRLDHLLLPDGSKLKIDYSLAALEKRYLGRDRSAEKEDDGEHWRLHYGMLDGLRAEEYPPEAAAYASEDAEGTLLVYQGQEDRKAQYPHSSTRTEDYQLYKAFCLRLETCWGMAVDEAEVARVRREVERELAGQRDLLVAAKVLRGGCGPRPHKRQMAKALQLVAELGADAGLDVKLENFDWEPYQEALTELGIKFTAPTAEKINTKRLQEVAAAAFKRLGEIPEMTAGRVDKEGVRHPQIKLDGETVERLAAFDPILAQYDVRQSLQKLVTNQLPILEQAPVIHFNYDALKETTRTSSYGNRKGKPALYPSANGQQIPKGIEGGEVKVDPRRCYRPREGTVFFDVDLHCLELACVGQVTHDLFGESVHLERYNAGQDLHAFLGAQILIHTTQQGAALEVQQAIQHGSIDDQYEAFLAFKRCGSPPHEKVFKDTRNLAKPNGLGFPGGIGPAKMCVLAWSSYRVRMEEREAHHIREIWRATYPEMPRYFDWVTSQRDYHNDMRSADGDPIELYWYETPMGVIRRGCTYCSIANGKAMQSPGAEAATAGNNAVVQACYDPTLGSVLLGARPIAFVHDQVIGETTRDQTTWHEQATEVSRLMIEAARIALPKVKMRTEALLTKVWSKSAEPTFDEAGRLIPWAPKVTK